MARGTATGSSGGGRSSGAGCLRGAVAAMCVIVAERAGRRNSERGPRGDDHATCHRTDVRGSRSC
jgi:hypothetical protein